VTDGDLFRTLGRTGVEVSTLCLGTMMFGAMGNTDHDECVRMVHQSLDAGINFVDTADIYSQGESEVIVGKALADPARRDNVVLATKFFNPMGDDRNRRGGSRRWIRQAVEESLTRLGTDRIDLYQMHRADYATHLDETLGALSDLVHEGKVLAIGCSTYPAEWIVEADRVAQVRGHIPFATEQPPYSILTRGIEKAVLPTCRRLGMGVLVWGPLNGGWLAGKYRKGEAPPADTRGAKFPAFVDVSDERKHDAVEKLAAIADQAGLDLTTMALAWSLAHPAVTSTIIGPRTPAQLEGNLAAMGVALPADVLDAIDAVVAPGTNLDPRNEGWQNPDLEPAARRRNAVPEW
jgi:aryl-alcohol dehydrogenase-like predicted oxidoreductase